MLATSHLPSANLNASPSHLLSPINLREAFLPTGNNVGDLAEMQAAAKNNKGEKAAAIEEAGDNKDVAGEENLERREGAEKPEGVVGASPAIKEEKEETLKEDPTWWWLSPYGPTAS